MSGLFSFERFVSATIIKIIYAFGLLAITITGVILIFTAGDSYGDVPFLQVLSGLAVILFGNLILRVLAEGAIVLFSIHDRLVSIDQHLAAAGSLASAQASLAGRTVTCPSCRKEVAGDYTSCPSCGYGFRRDPVSVGASARSTEGKWVCVKCGTSNQKHSQVCKGCGTYK